MNQEFPASKGHHTFLKRSRETVPDLSGKLVDVEQVAAQTYKLPKEDWSVQWVHNKWIENYTKQAGLDAIDPSTERPSTLARLLLRDEAFGGIAFDPDNDRIYKLNHSGMALLRELIEAGPARTPGPFRSKRYSSQQTGTFFSFLAGAGLWQGD